MLKRILFFILFLASVSGFSTTYYSCASGNWSTAATWSTAACGGASSLTAPGLSDDVIICAGNTVTMDGNAGACLSLTLNGTADWAAALTTNVGAGGITINSGGNITGAFNGILTTTGGLILNATLTSTTVTIITQTTAGQTISGTGSLARLTVNATTTNNGNITITTALAGASTLTQSGTATLTYGGAGAISPTLNAIAAGNTVDYNGAAGQTIKSTTYYNLTNSNAGTSTLGGIITVTNNLSVTGGTFATSTFQVTGNATGTLTLAAATSLTIGTNVLFPTNFIVANISLAATSTVTYQGNNAQTIPSALTYGNLTVNTFSGSKAADGDLTITGNLVITSPTTLDMSTHTLNLTGTLTSTGNLSFSSGNLNIGGTYTNSGTLTAGSGIATYNGVNQTVKSATYQDITIAGSGTKTLGGAITINGNLAVNAGTLATSTFQITGNTNGTFTLAGGTTLTIGATGSPTDVTFPTLFTNAHMTLAGTVTYQGNNAQTIASLPAYTNLTVNTFSGSKVADGDLTVTGNLIATSPATLDMSTHTLNLTGNYTGTGGLLFTSGNFNIGGSYTNTGILTGGTGTVNYNSNAAQTVGAVSYNNLTFSGSGAKTLQNVVTILGIAGNFTRGTMTVNAPGASSTVAFNGATQTMTGNAMAFRNLTLSNASLTINADITVNGILTFTTGNILTGANNVILPATGSVSRTSGYVDGNMRKNVATGSNVTRTFEIGTGMDYTPLDIIFTSVAAAGNLTVSSIAGDHPQLSSSGFAANKTVNRYWTIANVGVVYTNTGASYNATCTFVNGDKDAGLNTAACIVKTYSAGTWATPIVGTQGGNATQATTVTIPVSPNTIDLQIGENIGSPTGKLYSIATGNWSAAGTWSATSGGASCNCIPTNVDTVFIENNFTVTMDGNSGVARALNINTGGVATWTGALTTDIGTGGINVAATGDITGTGAGILTNQGNLVINKVLTNTAFTLKMALGTSQTISGTCTLAKLDISANTTNTGNLTVTTTLSSTVISTLTQGASATLIYGGTTLNPILNATVNPNTVEYNGAGNQTIRIGTYHNLIISNAGTSTLGAAITVNNDLLVTGGTLATSLSQITGNATGQFSVGAGAGLTLGLTTSATASLFPTNFTTGHITLDATSTVTYQVNANKTISSTPATYGNVTLLTGAASSTVTFSGATVPVSGNLNINTATVTLLMNASDLNVTGNLTGAGTLTFTTGNLNLGGNNTSTGTFNAGTGTVNYNGSGAQTIRAVNYNNLTFSGTGAKTLQNVVTVLGIAGDFNRGAMIVNAPGASSIVTFNGGAQTITGNAMAFRNLTLSNTSLTINADVTVNAVLTFTTGNIITGVNNVILPAAGSVSRTSGHVVGNLRKNFATGTNVSRTFEVGTGSDYTPLDITFASVTVAGNLTASATSGDHPQIASSGFTASSTVNRYWSISNTGITFTTYDATANFVNTDEDAGLNTSACIVKSYNAGAWGTAGVGSQAVNSTQGALLTVPTSGNNIDIQIGENIGSPTGKLYSIATGNWSAAGTWSATSGGASCNCVPTNVDTVFIENNFTVTMDGNSGVARALSINTGGIATWTVALTTDIGTGGINIASTGDITGAGAGTLTNKGNLVLNKVLTNVAFTVKMALGTGQTISGTGTLAKLDISANTTNNGNLTVTTTLASSTASTLTQGASIILTYGGTTAVGPTLDAVASGNTVDYNGAGNQTVKTGTYYDLVISNAGTSTLGGVITVNNNLSVTGGTLATSTFQITGNATGALSVGAGAGLTLAGTLAATTAFPSLFTNITLNTTSTVTYNSTGAQTIKALDYGTLAISGARTTANVTFEAAIIGIKNNTTTCFNPTATFTTGGYVTAGNTIEFKGSGAQTIRTFSYNNLISSGAGARTLLNAGTIGVGGVFTPGTNAYTVTNSTIDFNGAGSQNIPSLASNYNILKISNAGIKTLTANVGVISDLNISAATLDLSIYTANRTASGGTLSLAPGATLKVGGTSGGIAGSNFPANYTTNTLSGIVEFASPTNQVIPAFNYTDLTVSGVTTAPAGNFNVAGNFTNNGTFTHNGGTVTFNGTLAQIIGGSSTTSFKNITLNNSAGATLSSAQNLAGILTLTAGTFTTTGQTFTLLSALSGTASIATIVPGADIVGNITMQRYVSSGTTGWMLLSSPVTGATLQQWDDDFITGGFPGSQDPSVNSPSIVSYDETLPGIYDNGYVKPTAITDPIITNKGYWAYIVTSSPVNIDVTGTVTKGTQSMPVTYTDDLSQPASEDGWNLVANPYPSTIDWDGGGWTKTNINDAVYAYNPTLDQYSSYVAGMGINGGSNLIASSQGFLVQANGANPVLQITENEKTNTDGAFIRSQQTITDDFVKLDLSGNGYKDEAIVRFNSNASAAFDNNLDAMKFFSFNSNVPGMATVSNAVNYSVNALPLLTNNISLPLKVQVGVSGTYTIHLDSLSNLPVGTCLTLEDLLTGTTTDLRTNSSYSFYIKNTTVSTRFIIHICGTTASTVNEQKGSSNDLKDHVKIVSNHNSVDLMFDFNESTNTIIDIYNSIGQQVVTKKNIAAYKNNLSIDFSDKATGIYYIKIQAGDQIMVNKTLKE
jgi:hypothetical protein